MLSLGALPSDSVVPPGCGSGARLAGSSSELFEQGLIPCFEITLDANAYDGLRRKKRDFVRAGFRHGTISLDDVGVRLKGHRSMRGLESKPAFKIDFAKYVPGRRFLGLEHLTLNNMVDDPTLVSEALGYELYRAVGVPAPRVGYAEVIVNGRAYGLYANVESVDGVFLERHFDDASGPLYEGEYGCDLRSEDVSGFELDAGPDGEREELGRLASAALAGPHVLFFGERAPLDTPEFLAYLATSAFLADTDGYRHSHNYRVYFEPRDQRWRFLPWGIDRILRRPMGIFDFHGEAAKLCFESEACRNAYAREVERVARTAEREKLADRVALLAREIQTAEDRDRRKPHAKKATLDRRRALRAFLKERPEQVRRQVACVKDPARFDHDQDGYACNDCDDRDAEVHPEALELCDGADNDCSGAADDAPRCECQLFEADGAAFRLCPHAMTFADAARFCEAQGHTLARFDTRAQSRGVHRALRKMDLERAWIGLRDEHGDGTFAWHDGAPLTFTRWGRGEPDPKGCSPRCVAFTESRKGRWFNTHCSVRRPFVCREATPVSR